MSQSLQSKVIDVVIKDIQEKNEHISTTRTYKEQSTLQQNEDDENWMEEKYHKSNTAQILRKPPEVIHLLAGATAGAVAKTIIAPLDRTKIWFQVTEKRFTMTKAFVFLHETRKNDGVMALWRGNSATMVRIVPYAAIQFASHERWKKVLQVDSINNRNATYLRFVAGSLAGVTAQLVSYPLDLVRARMAITPRREYGSMMQVFVNCFRNDGILGLYRGISPTIIGVIPYAGFSFGTYETLKSYHKNKTGLEKPRTIERTLFGAFAGLLGQSSSYPLDIVRRRMQTANITGNGNAYVSIISTLVIVYRKEGIIRGWYKGLSLNWIKGPIAVGISFSMYESVKDFLESLL